MPNYAGETVEVTNQATDQKGEPLTPDRVSSVTITIVDRDDAVIIDEEPMDWDEDESMWVYQWDTADDIEPGTYQAKCSIVGPGDWDSFEYQKIRLQRKKF